MCRWWPVMYRRNTGGCLQVGCPCRTSMPRRSCAAGRARCDGSSRGMCRAICQYSISYRYSRQCSSAFAHSLLDRSGRFFFFGSCLVVSSVSGSLRAKLCTTWPTHGFQLLDGGGVVKYFLYADGLSGSVVGCDDGAVASIGSLVCGWLTSPSLRGLNT